VKNPTKERLMKNFRIACRLLAASLFLMPATSAGSDEAARFIREKVEGVIEVLKIPGLDRDVRRERIMEIVSPAFDFSLMAKLTLGRRYWPRLEPAEREEFVRLFIEQLKRSYLEKAKSFSDEKLEYLPPEESGNKVEVATRVLRPDGAIEMRYKLYRKEGSWHVYDLEIQDISIVKSYGSQYTQFLAEKSVEELLNEMRKKLEAENG
jgi:phospholipid transport system substrate-binding protein